MKLPLSLCLLTSTEILSLNYLMLSRNCLALRLYDVSKSHTLLFEVDITNQPISVPYVIHLGQSSYLTKQSTPAPKQVTGQVTKVKQGSAEAQIPLAMQSTSPLLFIVTNSTVTDQYFFNPPTHSINS